MKTIIAFSLVMLSALTAAAQDGDLQVVPSVDLQRYAGTWYEIARLPNRFQKQCTGDVSATYTLLEDGAIRVVNRCRNDDGQFEEATGRARLADRDGPSSKLKVRFAPAFLSFLPNVWGDYWILDLAPDYSHVLIGEPARKYLWVLARTPVMDEAVLEGVLAKARQQGYDLAPLLRTPQTAR